MRSSIIIATVLLTACADKPPPEPRAAPVKRDIHVSMTKELSEHETMRVVIVPNPLGPYFDTACVLYTNRELKTSSMQCPDADKQSLLDTP